jgi:hypothetical protein
MRRYFAMLGVLLWACATLAWGAPARADGSDKLGRARALAEQAADLLDAKNYTEALDRASQAEAIFHAPTHVLMIGQAHEGLGHLAAAADTYEQLVAEPLPRSAPRAFLAAQATAKQRLTPLLSRVPSLLLKVQAASGAPPGAVTATVDGRTFALKPGMADRLDPGKHVLRVMATGFKASEQSLALPEKGGVTILEVALERDEGPAQPVPASVPPEPTSTPPPEQPAPTVAKPASGSRVPAYIAFGAGGAGLLLGTITGALSLAQVGTLNSQCKQHVCASTEQGTINSAKTLGVVSDVGFAVGIAGVGAGVVLLIVRPGAPKDSAPPSTGPSASGFSVEPWIGPRSLGAVGRF